MEIRIWDKKENKWAEGALIDSRGRVRTREDAEWSSDRYEISIGSTATDRDKNRIFDQDIVEAKGSDRLYIAEFTGCEFILRDATSENPKYDDDSSHEYGEVHNEPLSRYRFSKDLKIKGNAFENPELILNS